ncbi:uncharacterized MFS-type transporter C09D4.1-like isoform X2 [Planococcus citri]|uniref:uncharacterized MFS-type transporter C09D4.1-like isoform X2 n=1 Tax=Planococcus citri TaxID=170843 RepID=UPI0031F7BD04
MKSDMDFAFKLSKRRWLIMILFMIYAINGAIQWVQFSIISDLVVKYYNDTSATQVEWTTTCFMLAYVIFIVPSLYLLDKVGVRNTLIIGATGVTIGTWIKVFSVHRDRFFLVLIGQSFQAVFQILTFGLCARFTAIWFGANEISIAGALGLFGDQLGTALAFYVPPALVKDGTPETIGEGLKKMHWLIAGSSTAVLLMIVLFFKSAPKLPPSAAQAKQRQSEKENVFQALKSILRKRAFIFILLSYGWNVGSFNAIATLLNQIVLVNFPDGKEDAGRIGFIMMVSGMFCSLIVGKILDKTRKFKETAVFLTTGSAITYAAFSWSLKSGSLTTVYVVSFFIGFFILSYYGTGFQMAIEVTFPVSEGISSAILFLSVQMHGCLITIVYGYAVKLFGDLPSNIGLTVLFSISAIFACLIPADLKRQSVEKSVHGKIHVEETKDFI